MTANVQRSITSRTTATWSAKVKLKSRPGYGKPHPGLEADHAHVERRQVDQPDTCAAVGRRQSELIHPRAGEYVRYLAPHEPRLALLRKCRQRFAMVGGGKAQRLHGLAKQQVLLQVGMERTSEQLLHESEPTRRAVGETAGDLVRLLEQVLVRHDAIDEPERFCAPGVEHVAERAQLVGPTVAEDLGQQIAYAEWGEPEMNVGGAELGLVRGNDHVAGQGCEESDAHGIAVDGRDHRLVHGNDLLDQPAELMADEFIALERRRTGISQAPQVAAGGECLTGSSQDDDPNVGSILGASQRLAQLTSHPNGVAVEAGSFSVTVAMRSLVATRTSSNVLSGPRSRNMSA